MDFLWEGVVHQGGGGGGGGGGHYLTLWVMLKFQIFIGVNDCLAKSRC